jgi:hypothetical protein
MTYVPLVLALACGATFAHGPPAAAPAQAIPNSAGAVIDKTRPEVVWSGALPAPFTAPDTRSMGAGPDLAPSVSPGPARVARRPWRRPPDPDASFSNGGPN